MELPQNLTKTLHQHRFHKTKSNKSKVFLVNTYHLSQGCTTFFVVDLGSPLRKKK